MNLRAEQNSPRVFIGLTLTTENRALKQAKVRVMWGLADQPALVCEFLGTYLIVDPTLPFQTL